MSTHRYAAFLRGMNLGGRRITNDELCGCFEELGFTDVAAFLASGNVIFSSSEGSAGEVAREIEEGLESSLGYSVPTFLRDGREVREIAASEPFSEEERARSTGKVQVGLLAAEPDAAARRAVLGLATEDDRLAIDGRTFYWLPRGGISQSDLDFRPIDKALGQMTVRTQRTIRRIAAKYFEEG